ncbi:MAG: CDP-diacylglycerol--glycerol-3-phosphate 3-phosphatidyltransferase [Pseudomonadota bacterium]|nr:CDP-diacylglycerol--glycerol-3-phosphate 3-phosphatidyltransferase [Pseudomonadota bacterium]
MRLSDLPNGLTILRLVCVPILLGTCLLPAEWSNWLALSIFVVAGITDYLDGALARRLNVVSEFGRMLDPIADKLMVASVLLLLLWQGVAPLIPVVVIIGRELVVSGLREYLALVGQKLAVTSLAKWKTTLQFIALAVLLAAGNENFPTPPRVTVELIGLGLVWLSALLTLVSGYDYCAKARSYAEQRRLGTRS